MMNTIATAIVLAVAGALVAAMIVMIRISGDDSGKHTDLKQFVEALFGGSASLAASKETPEERQAEKAIALQAAAKQPFTEPCPACGDPVTHQDVDCPSCGLRLLSPQ
ncbi:hypothetical protein [Paenibacillus sp. OV219]|uniref:hypothetical protein n=1 Tax=Paenibacillus sp. OV219 TaxID=1884377 RepID=UPI0008D540CE|nr:hypothetical protein [Paenibacillus sp. OV219]SEO41460.1 hypothetical protein SAMN05518847_107340 [Paenibacillus sp. OV219]